MAELEVCIDDVAGLEACVKGRADRIELCSALSAGGLTPSAGFMQLAGTLAIPVNAMIRPRAGDFCFTPGELHLMCNDISKVSEAGLQGVVLGAATADNELDVSALATMVTTAGTLKKTLHRVIDTVADPFKAIDQAVDLGFDHILTSGGRPSVDQGIDQLEKLQRHAQGRITIMAGAGLTPASVLTIHQHTGIESFHASCRNKTNTNRRMVAMGFASTVSYKTNAQKIREFQQILATLVPGKQH